MCLGGQARVALLAKIATSKARESLVSSALFSIRGQEPRERAASEPSAGTLLITRAVKKRHNARFGRPRQRRATKEITHTATQVAARKAAAAELESALVSFYKTQTPRRVVSVRVKTRARAFLIQSLSPRALLSCWCCRQAPALARAASNPSSEQDAPTMRNPGRMVRISREGTATLVDGSKPLAIRLRDRAIRDHLPPVLEAAIEALFARPPKGSA